MAALMHWMNRVEVANTMEVKQIEELAALYGAEFHKGKPKGKPGEFRYSCYVDAEPFGGRDYLRDKVVRILPGAKVFSGEMYMGVKPV